MTASYLWLIPFLPLLGAVITGGLSLAGAKTAQGPNRGFSALIGVLFPALAFAVTVAATGHLARVPDGGSLLQHLWTWMVVGDLKLGFGLLFDRLSSMMLLFITGIGTLITLYSVGYMWTDRGFTRFLCYLNLFLFSMVMLVLGDSLLVTFLGWEGVGLCSYLLVGFWHQTTEYNDAARKAFVVNRVGDLGFLLGSFAIVAVVGSLNYQDIARFFQGDANAAVIAAKATLITGAALLIFFGCTGKSAQIPLLTWLPDAMAGPTPVSALIHAATMVTSGVYLVARLGDLYVHATLPVLGLAPLDWILITGCATAVFGAVAGLFQNDIKKALAYSTVSQLGFMFMAVGAGSFDVGLFHVFTHAFFKATLFLGAGMVIHLLHHEQDMRKMGGLWALPQTGFVLRFAMFWAWWAILGLPYGSGFFSKDFILEKLLAGGGLHFLVGLIAVATAGITAVYMTRMMVLTFWSPSRISSEAKSHLQSIPFTMQFPVLVLGIGSVVTGIMFWSDSPFIGESFRTHTFENWLGPVLGMAQDVYVQNHHEHGPISHGALFLGVPFGASVLAVIGALIAWKVWGKGPTGRTVAEQPSSAPYGFGAGWTWAFDHVYDVAVVKPIKFLGFLLYWVVEMLLIAGLTYGIGLVISLVASGIAALQRSRLRSSLGMSLLGAAAIIILVFSTL